MAKLTSAQLEALKQSELEAERNAHVFYNDSYTAFSHLYHQNAYTDVSLAAFLGEKPIARLTLLKKENELSFFGFPGSVTLVPGLDPGVKNTVVGGLIKQVEEIASEMGGAVLKLEIGEDFARGLYPHPHQTHVHYYSGVDLNAPEASLRQCIRRRYRSMVNWGEKNLKTEILYGPEGLDRFDAFRTLHLEVAGRVTRPASSWEIQKEQVKRKEAYVVLCTLDGAVVAGVLTICTPTAAYYGVAAANRAIMAEGKALGHWPMWCSLLHARKIGLKEYFTGYFPDADSSAKELSIIDFKLGFSTFVRTAVSWEIQLKQQGESRDE